ncbi:hypothetical protein DRJ16_00170 [Candidatus Woesearchaeota archaeon]|nr:MAG: hypothetical protein DRJ16_00170 [Candidatus Woesearchaeota archaeon]
MPEAPIYVKVDEYKDVLDLLNMIKNKLAEAKELLSRINELKNEEDAELELWHSGIEEIEKKIEFVDKALFKPSML